VSLAGGAPFISDADLDQALQEAGLPPEQAQAIVDENEEARIAGLRLSLAVLALFAAVGLYLSRLLPTRPVGSAAVPRAA
jgi:hypothetical protein